MAPPYVIDNADQQLDAYDFALLQNAVRVAPRAISGPNITLELVDVLTLADAFVNDTSIDTENLLLTAPEVEELDGLIGEDIDMEMRVTDSGDMRVTDEDAEHRLVVL